ncbi:radical SAM protein [Candidatus Microgenomates bacterium]|nr:radical SAM protein [Candidatus Microgenomates bacterium]
MNCNFYCKHCGSNAGRKTIKGELTVDEIKKTFRTIAEDFNPKDIMVAVTGGEPLVRKDLFEIMTYVNHLGFNWGMVTNGFLVNKEIVKKMKESGMKTIVVSIDGIGRKHDEFRSMKGAYHRAINAVRLLSEANFMQNLQITTTIHQGNIDQLEEMYRTFSSLSIHSWRVFNVDPIGRAEFNTSLLLNNKQLKKLLLFIKEKRAKSKIDVTYGCAGFLGLEFEGKVRKNLFYCNTGINTASILFNGDIYVCPNVPRIKALIQGNVKRDRFSIVWDKKFQFFRDKNRTRCDKCIKCNFWEECLGNSFHLWDFSRKQPKICHLEMLSQSTPLR